MIVALLIQMELIMRSLKFLLSIMTLSLPMLSYANGCGAKWDMAPVFVHVDVLHEGHTIKKLDMGGFKTNGTIMIKEGWGFCIKPDILYAQGHGELISGSIGIGHVTPITNKLCITPTVGESMTNLRTSYTDHSLAPFGISRVHLKERFRSTAPFIALEATYKICEGLRIGGSFMYSWSRCHTRLENNSLELVKKIKSHSAGPTWSALIEKDLNECWSVNAGASYNSSLDKSKKEGLRGYGFKLGVARWF